MIPGGHFIFRIAWSFVQEKLQPANTLVISASVLPKAERWSAHVCKNVEILGAWDSRLHHSFWCFSRPRYVWHTQHTRKFNVLNFCSMMSGRNKGPFVWFLVLTQAVHVQESHVVFFLLKVRIKKASAKAVL
jgi:hypothetical protein